jgi:hypothetical protein
MYGNDFEYASTRLKGTIVRIGEEPIIIGDVYGGDRVTFAYLERAGEALVCKLSDLNLKPVSLGMCNFLGEATFLCRMPMRNDWKQGLRRGNFRSLCGAPAELAKPLDLWRVITNKYPKFTECLGSLADVKSMAWCREWAITKGHSLLYKGYGVVGSYVGGQFVLDNDYKFLDESLEESL